MAKQQKRSKQAPVRTVRGSKSKQSSKKGLVIVFLLLVSLTTLIVASIYAFKDEKDGKIAKTINNKIESVKKKDVDKKDTAPDKKVSKSDSSQPKEKQAPKADVVKKEPTKGGVNNDVNYRRDDDIVALIRLVLYDYEISRTAVKEVATEANGIQRVNFTITTSDDMVGKIRGTLNSLLAKKGYRTKINKKTIVATGSSQHIEIEFISQEVKSNKQTDKIDDSKVDKKPNRRAVAQADAKLDKKQIIKEERKASDNRPTPPEKSPIVVKMGILLDDGGANYSLAERFVKLRYPVAVAILPHLQYSKEIAKLASSYKKTIFLHFPMEPKSYPSTDPGEGAALVNMPEVLIRSVLKYNISSLGIPVDGVNNHMGSAFTEDRTKMAQALSAIKEYTPIFIDSRTSSSSVAYEECVHAGMRCGANNKFIDNHNNVNYILERIYEAAENAKADGSVIVIGHMRAKTLDALEIALPILQERNIIITPLEQIIR